VPLHHAIPAPSTHFCLGFCLLQHNLPDYPFRVAISGRRHMVSASSWCARWLTLRAATRALYDASLSTMRQADLPVPPHACCGVTLVPCLPLPLNATNLYLVSTCDDWAF